ncbi:hypothetical protein F503_08336 [Ophiostoma piceae UAMH 11346]|uniref:Uncharacterized protein n=1 Tax=Ophiostoma piceae (strain UAMH 11346) TaxID=1262450 RepID=S3CY48_OPHP1|nr:hypothetical protein F503_08336 [Ophiostoma piceae UAMH 11346]
MPPKRVTRPLQRQLSLETPAMTSDPDIDSDDNGFNPVKAASALQKSIEGHKKRRFAARKRIEKKYQAKVADIVKLAEARLAERQKNNCRAHLRQEQMAQLVAAIETRDAKQRAVADRVGRFYDSCMNLTSLLQRVYTGLAEEARQATLSDTRHGTAPV